MTSGVSSILPGRNNSTGLTTVTIQSFILTNGDEYLFVRMVTGEEVEAGTLKAVPSPSTTDFARRCLGSDSGMKSEYIIRKHNVQAETNIAVLESFR